MVVLSHTYVIRLASPPSQQALERLQGMEWCRDVRHYGVVTVEIGNYIPEVMAFRATSIHPEAAAVMLLLRLIMAEVGIVGASIQ